MHGWVEYHAGRIDLDALARILATFRPGGVTPLDGCQPPQGPRPAPS